MSAELDATISIPRTAEAVIRAAMRNLAAEQVSGFVDIGDPDAAVDEVLGRFRAHPVAPEELGSRQGGVLGSGLAGELLASPILTSVVAQIVVLGIKAGASSARNGVVGRWRARRRRAELGAALADPVPDYQPEDIAWLTAYVTAQCVVAGCPAEWAPALANAVVRAWIRDRGESGGGGTGE